MSLGEKLVFLAAFTLVSCAPRNYRACVISPVASGCTRPLPKEAAEGIAEYVGKYDSDAIVIVIKKGQKLPAGHVKLPEEPPKQEKQGEKL